jgi:hypothetical protein
MSEICKYDHNNDGDCHIHPNGCAEALKTKKEVNQDKGPNFRGEGGKLYLVRCFACGDSERGRENYGPAVSSGTCAWCGWSENNQK